MSCLTSVRLLPFVYLVLMEGSFIQLLGFQSSLDLPVKWATQLSLAWLIWLLDVDFQACSLPFSTWPPMPTSAPMPPVERRGLRCSASSWSTCLAGLFDMPSAGSVMGTVRILEASTVFYSYKCTHDILYTAHSCGYSALHCLACLLLLSSTPGPPMAIQTF